MARARTIPTLPEAPVRQSPSQREHELAMAYATKTPRTTSSTTDVGTYTNGAKQGDLYLKSHVTVRDEGEDWPQYIGRVEAELRDLVAVNDQINAARVTADPAKDEA